MPQPMQRDEYGRPVFPRFAANDKPKTRLQEIREYIAGADADGLLDFAESNGIDPDLLRLCLIGLFEQRVTTAMRVLDRPKSWVKPRVDRLRKMGLWVGSASLGGRFASWLDENGGMEALLDCMEIDGVVESKMVAGERRYRLRKDKNEPKPA